MKKYELITIYDSNTNTFTYVLSQEGMSLPKKEQDQLIRQIGNRIKNQRNLAKFNPGEICKTKFFMEDNKKAPRSLEGLWR